MYQEAAKELFAFIEQSPSTFHVIDNMKNMLGQQGFEELKESENWNLKEGGSYYVTRNGSSLIAFKIPKKDFKGFHIMASHSDAPTFRIKEHGEMDVEKLYTKLNVEKYGGMLMAPWFDRPLSVAGRIVIKEENQIKTKLVSVDRDLVMIPNLAIHMNREANDGYKYNPQKDMLPLLGDGDAKESFLAIIAQAAGVEEEEIIGCELSLYNRMKGTIWGAKGEFISSPRLDDLQCVFSSLKGFLKGGNSETVTVCAVFDNEEVGSGTKQGAASTFLKDTLQRVNFVLGRTKEDYLKALASGFMISADNGHAVHPNQPDKTDPTNRPRMNGGILIKHSANQKYTTDAISAAMIRMICAQAKVPYQDYLNRSDILGGSTLGNISNMQVAINTADIGVAQLAMHSPYETGGVKDTYYLQKMAETFYSSSIVTVEDGQYEINF
ncbi:MAG: M18 family aminopeptidase [Anaerostipes sp.]|uniref:M18 family aminopeptidase n=1 Tax=Anaerostipes sp. 992a TaxID=1261637 RepID=UPI000952754B|nr:M18 family aminopeptidase [Anaerostipes sp. 992a]MCI5951856.1 M18 family aminopeptidase [Anaerostipes sp.]OLR62110.1 M18 family aminopeptidase [Anaerostipes sp. 992a]